MLTLSDVSIEKLMQCQDHQNDVKELLNLRRCSLRLNRTATLNDLHKLKLLPLTLSFNRSELSAHIGLDLKEYILEKLLEQPDEMIDDGEDLTLEQYAMMNKLMNKHYESHTKYTMKRKEYTANVLVRKAIGDAVQKVRSINKLKLSGLILNNELLQIIKRIHTNIRGASELKIDMCKIEWTEDWLFEFLGLFVNLKELYIAGLYSKPVVTDQHLSIASLQKITITNQTQNIQHFPGITSKSCDSWLMNGIKRVYLLNIKTELSFSAINKLAESLKLAEWEISKPLDDDEDEVKLVCGTIKLSEKDDRKIIQAQRFKNKEWEIYEVEQNSKSYTVHGKNTVSYQFDVNRPM